MGQEIRNENILSLTSFFLHYDDASSWREGGGGGYSIFTAGSQHGQKKFPTGNLTVFPCFGLNRKPTQTNSSWNGYRYQSVEVHISFPLKFDGATLLRLELKTKSHQ